MHLVQPFPLFRHPAQPACPFDWPRLAEMISGIINIIIIIDRAVSSKTRGGERRSTIIHASSIISQPSYDNISMMPACKTQSLSFLCASQCTATRLSLHCSSKPLDASSHLASPSHQTAFPTLLLFCSLSPTPPLSFVQLPPCARPSRSHSFAPASLPNARGSLASHRLPQPAAGCILFGPSPMQRNAPMPSCRTPPCLIR